MSVRGPVSDVIPAHLHPIDHQMLISALGKVALHGFIRTVGTGVGTYNTYRASDKTKPRPRETFSATPIAKRVVANMRRHERGKVVDIRKFCQRVRDAEALQKTVVSQKEIAALDLAHAAYVYIQNHVSVMSERFAALKEIATIAETHCLSSRARCE